MGEREEDDEDYDTIYASEEPLWEPVVVLPTREEVIGAVLEQD